LSNWPRSYASWMALSTADSWGCEGLTPSTVATRQDVSAEERSVRRPCSMRVPHGAGGCGRFHRGDRPAVHLRYQGAGHY
jgi:hypothetical protein